MTSEATSHSRFQAKYEASVARNDSLLCIGLDPDPALVPAGVDVMSFLREIIAATSDLVACYKPNAAFFEALPGDPFAMLREVVAAVPQDVPVLLDAKRGDIGSTARAYAAAYLEGESGPLADALTVNPYLGRDSIEPFLAACRRHSAGLFVLVKTSNAGSADVQDLTLSDGRTVWMQVAALVDEWGEELVGENGLSSVGAVVGATFPREVGEARRLMPRSIILLPGIGEQGGTPADVARAFASGPASALVSASRSVIYAYRSGSGDWRASAGAEAARLRADVWAVSGW